MRYMYLINQGDTEMNILIDENTDRATLEIAAIFECEFDLDAIETASDDDLRRMIADWVMDGDECAAA